MGVPAIEKKESIIVESTGQPKIDDSTTEISNIVFARDPSIIDKATGNVSLLEAF